MAYLDKVMASLPTIKKTITGRYALVSPSGEVVCDKLKHIYAKDFDPQSKDAAFERGYVVADNAAGEKVLVSLYGHTALLNKGNSLNDRRSNADAVYALPSHLLRMIEGGFFMGRENELEFYFDIIMARVKMDQKCGFSPEAAEALVDEARELLFAQYDYLASADAVIGEIDKLMAEVNKRAELKKKLGRAKELALEVKRLSGQDSQPGEE